jgi:hypothetical protein
MKIRDPKTAYHWVVGAIVACVGAFVLICVRIDAARPHYQPRPASPFPGRLLASPSSQYLHPDPTLPDDPNASSPDPDSSAESSEGDAENLSPATEQRIVAYARALKDSDPSAPSAARNATDREAVLSAAQKIESYRAVSPNGPLPQSLKWEIEAPAVEEALRRARARSTDFSPPTPSLSPDPLRRPNGISSRSGDPGFPSSHSASPMPPGSSANGPTQPGVPPPAPF